MNFYSMVTSLAGLAFAGFSVMCVLRIIRMGMDHKLALEKIRHGYPLDEAEPRKHERFADFTAEERLQ